MQLVERRGLGRRGPGGHVPAGPGDDAGQITLLAIGFAVLALALILVVASASAVHIERKRLLALADAAVADAADAVDAGAYYGGGGAGAPGVPLTDASVEAAALAHLAASPSASRFAGLAVVEPTGSPDGRRAEVTLTAVTRPPLVPWVLSPWSDGITLRVSASALAD
ncbi:pilus assembly protein TadG-related protein [Georgenia faecalis]|uniref:pilus assembly protein TadG-related protein n=1 Tax=Georgenia faecalis TaxID=2483799 RepID=UPI001F49BD46|nr:pilus assembly protein TadG-related protein [Georgenia faecalis]